MSAIQVRNLNYSNLEDFLYENGFFVEKATDTIYKVNIQGLAGLVASNDRIRGASTRWSSGLFASGGRCSLTQRVCASALSSHVNDDRALRNGR